MFDVDGALVGYSGLAPEPLIELIAATRRGAVLHEPVVRPLDSRATAGPDWRELFKGIYLKRTLTIWGL
jgi:hypothetical protein